MNNEIEQLLIQLEYFIEENYKYYNNFELDKNQVKQLLDCITNLKQDNTMYAQLKDEYEEEIEDLKKNNEELLLSYKAQKDINHQQLSMVIKRDKKLKIYKSIIEKLAQELKTTYNKEYYYKYNGKYLKSEINTELLKLVESRGN